MEKQRIFAGLHRIPPSTDWATLAEEAATPVGEDSYRQPKGKEEMLLATWHYVEQLTLLTLQHQNATQPSSQSIEEPTTAAPPTRRRESAETKSASLGRNAFLQVGSSCARVKLACRLFGLYRKAAITIFANIRLNSAGTNASKSSHVVSRHLGCFFNAFVVVLVVVEG